MGSTKHKSIDDDSDTDCDIMDTVYRILLHTSLGNLDRIMDRMPFLTVEAREALTETVAESIQERDDALLDLWSTIFLEETSEQPSLMHIPEVSKRDPPKKAIKKQPSTTKNTVPCKANKQTSPIKNTKQRSKK